MKLIDITTKILNEEEKDRGIKILPEQLPAYVENNYALHYENGKNSTLTVILGNDIKFRADKLFFKGRDVREYFRVMTNKIQEIRYFGKPKSRRYKIELKDGSVIKLYEI
jgi:hypothetical protein